MRNELAEALWERGELLQNMLAALERHDAGEARRLSKRIAEANAEITALRSGEAAFKARVAAAGGKAVGAAPTW